jgi:hypothetical protein
MPAASFYREPAPRGMSRNSRSSPVMAPINVCRRGDFLRVLAANGFGYRFLIPAFGVVSGVESGNWPAGGFRRAEVGEVA